VTNTLPGEINADLDINDSEQLRYVAAQAADARVNIELETEGMTLNIGPQHPATHGTLRIVARLDGEQVIEAEPIMGYMHRGSEKLSEVRPYPQVTTLINRIDWVGSFANEVPFILAAEELMEIEAPPRAQYIRTALFEMGRIANIMLFLGDMAVQLGGVTAIFYAFRDREFVLNQIESATGGRFHPNFNRIGGVKDDLPAGWIKETKSSMQKATASVAPTSVVLASTGTCVATQIRRLLLGRTWTGRSGPTQTATPSAATGFACKKRARPRTWSSSCSTAFPPDRSWPKCPASSRSPRASRTS